MEKLTVFVRCLRQVQYGAQLHPAGAELNLREDEAAELLPLGAVELVEVEEEVLIGIELAPALLVIGDRKFSAEDVLRAAFDKSGCSVTAWNGLHADRHRDYIDMVIAQAVPPKGDDQGRTDTTQSGVDSQQSSETVGEEPGKSPAAEPDLPAAGTGGDVVVQDLAAQPNSAHASEQSEPKNEAVILSASVAQPRAPKKPARRKRGRK